MKIIGICDKDTAIGLRLAGVKDLYIPNGNAINIWNEISDRNDIGIIFINEKIVEDIYDRLNDYRIRNILPIIVEIPDKQGRKRDHIDYISNLIKKAVGVEISK
jgi:V/A-type H+-transporting ATPase subunit F